MTKKVLLIGGGTGGHIFPLRNLVDELKKRGAEIELLLADKSLDRKIAAENFNDIPCHFLKTGKIRRYLSFQNFIDLFPIVRSIFAARKLLTELKPDILFFKGGFVGFPILIAAKYLGGFQGKIFSHESDISPGFLTKISEKHSEQTFSNFGDPPFPLFYAPLPRANQKAFDRKRKQVLIFGGSLGAQFLNELFLQCSKALLKKYSITLISGSGKGIPFDHPYFEQYELLPAQKLSQKICESDVIVTRGGGNSISEIVAAKKPSIIIPLPSSARNHQMLNAQYFKQKGLCYVLEQNKSTHKKLVPMIENILQDQKLQKALQQSNIHNAASKIAEIILHS